ncbi:GntR family transcriptional regulator [Victivallis vadensis]|jgi:DNA-binding LacI/PurR family transcriptional regulator|uniref:GntR family transcriptional regulator n=2 Tax=Victivallis vadensis TaxID=172901 RepID=UPI0023EF6BD4|nr:GntR family transcriptional regulator [Victivallis vadensis]
MSHIAKIAEELKEGRWGKEGKLPSFRKLAQHYSCSLTVVQQAIRILDEEGCLRTFQGKGTYWTNGKIHPSFHRNRIIGVTYLSGCFKIELETLKEEWLNAGWFLAGYNADIHRQNPVREREFVLQARHEHFSAMVMLATPLAPGNAPLFARMRLEGMKIAHLVPYQETMEHESYFCSDYAAAGRLAAAQIARCGYTRLILFREGASADRNLNYRGVLEMGEALGLEIHPDFDPERRWQSADADAYLEDPCATRPFRLDTLLDLPDNCCICSQSPYLLHQIRLLRQKYSASASRRIGYLCLDDFSSDQLPVSRITYDRQQQLRTALEYAANSAIDALEPIQQLFAPRYLDRGSL